MCHDKIHLRSILQQTQHNKRLYRHQGLLIFQLCIFLLNFQNNSCLHLITKAISNYLSFFFIRISAPEPPSTSNARLHKEATKMATSFVKRLFVSPEINPSTRKAKSIPVLNPFDQYGRVFFFSWLGFMVAFLSWYAFPPLVSS